MSNQPIIAVIGGGMIGMTSALRLADAGCHVSLYEQHEHLGGLSDTYTWQGLTWDRFYHVVLSTDQHLIDLLSELDLTKDIFWRETRSGFFRDDRLVSMSTIADFVTFPFLSLWHKFRLGVGILISARIRNVRKLDRVFVRAWLTRLFGRRVYERFWDPLLRSKFGEARNRTSAAFMWATISRLYGARSGENKTEKMGHVNGGYSRILAAFEARLKSAGVQLATGTEVTSIRPGENGGVLVTYGGQVQAYKFDAALMTVPAPVALHLSGGDPMVDKYWRDLEAVSYLGIVCLLVVLKRRLSPYYVTNLLDTELPFTGIIEATNIVDSATLSGYHWVYLPKYVTANDPLQYRSDTEVTDEFLAGLRQVHPDLEESSIAHTKVFRETYVQPLQELNYLDRTNGIATPIPGIYLANSAMLYNSTLNNNAAIDLAGCAADTILEMFNLKSMMACSVESTGNLGGKDG